MAIPSISAAPIERVRGILLTENNSLLLIKRVKPNNTKPYWVAPGGGVEPVDRTLRAALTRELEEELGAQVEIVMHAFTLRHEKGGKNLREYFYVCRLLRFDLKQRSGPEFNDPTRGEYLPDFVPLTEPALRALNMKTPELTDWIIVHLDQLRCLR
ncbi:NUDIX domain-containing protein [Aggregatilineales bacterium SYSU G02658]